MHRAATPWTYSAADPISTGHEDEDEDEDDGLAAFLPAAPSSPSSSRPVPDLFSNQRSFSSHSLGQGSLLGQNLLLATMAALPATQSGDRGTRGQIRGGGGTRASATGTGGGRRRRRRKRRGAAAAEEEAEGAEWWRLALRSGRGVPARDGSEVGTAMGGGWRVEVGLKEDEPRGKRKRESGGPRVRVCERPSAPRVIGNCVACRY